MLDRKAEKKLKEDNESVIVKAFFSRIPKNPTEEENNLDGDRFLCSKEIELFFSRTVQFKNIKFSKKLYNSLLDKDIKLLVNVFSGRRSISYNILDCEDISEKMSIAINKTFTINGKLNE